MHIKAPANDYYVYINGEEQNFVIEVDTETGLVRRAVVLPDGKFKTENGELVIETLYVKEGLEVKHVVS